MKKIALTMIMAVITITASAQAFIGGEVSLWRNANDGANKTTFAILPEVGYSLSPKWAIGTVVGYQHVYNAGSKTNLWTVQPYARYTLTQFGPVSVFLDGGFGFATYKVTVGDVKGDAQNAWSVGIKPGLAVNLTKKLSFVTHVGFLGYRDADGSEVLGSEGFGFSLSGNDVSFGVYYNF